MNTPDPEPVDLSKLKPGPIRHESLPTELLEHVQAIYDVVGPYLDMTLEQFEIGFMRDANPASESPFGAASQPLGSLITSSTLAATICQTKTRRN